MKKTYLFCYAHLDDEAILSYGTMKRLKEEGNEIYIACACGFGRKAEPSESKKVKKQKMRYNVFVDEMLNSLGLSQSNVFPGSYTDLSLTREQVEFFLSSHISLTIPDVLVTHFSDLHPEHCLFYNLAHLCCRRRIVPTHLCCRKKTEPILFKKGVPVKELWCAAGPTELWTYEMNKSEWGGFCPNLFVDISKYMDQKMEILQKYSKVGELPSANNDLRSKSSVKLWNSIFGRMMGTEFAEPYVQCFKFY